MATRRRIARNIAGFMDAEGRFHPIRSGTRLRSVGKGRKRKTVKVKDVTAYIEGGPRKRRKPAKRKAHNTRRRNPESTFRSLPVGATFRFSSSSSIAGGGAFLGSSHYRKTGPRSYQPADMAAAGAALLKLYSGYPDIRKKLKGAELKRSLTLRVGSINAGVIPDAGNGSVTDARKTLGKWLNAKAVRVRKVGRKMLVDLKY